MVFYCFYVRVIAANNCNFDDDNNKFYPAVKIWYRFKLSPPLKRVTNGLKFGFYLYYI